MINPHLTRMMALARQEDLRRRAYASRRHTGGPPARAPATDPITLRFGFPDDDGTLARLAALDSAEPPRHPVLLAEVSGELRAALSLADGAAVADPFHPSDPLLELLRARARQLRGGLDRSPRRRLAARLSLPALR